MQIMLILSETGLRGPVDPEQHPCGGPGGKAPGSSLILVILGVKFNQF